MFQNIRSQDPGQKWGALRFIVCIQSLLLSTNIASAEKDIIERCHKDNSKKATLIFIARDGKPLIDIVIPETLGEGNSDGYKFLKNH